MNSVHTVDFSGKGESPSAEEMLRDLKRELNINSPISGSTGVRCVLRFEPTCKRSKHIKVRRSDLEYIADRMDVVEDNLTENPVEAMKWIGYIKRKLNDIGVY